MRRSDREITGFTDIMEVLNRCDTVRVGMNGADGFPYVLPLSFGCEVVDGKAVIYVHGAKEGMKHELIARDNRVCIEADICHSFKSTGHSITAEYESVIGYGHVRTITGEQARHGLKKIVEHCSFPEYQLPEGVENSVIMYAIDVERITGKHRFVK